MWLLWCPYLLYNSKCWRMWILNSNAVSRQSIIYAKQEALEYIPKLFHSISSSFWELRNSVIHRFLREAWRGEACCSSRALPLRPRVGDIDHCPRLWRFYPKLLLRVSPKELLPNSTFTSLHNISYFLAITYITYINFIYTTHIIYINDIVFSHLLHLHHTHHLHQRHRLQTFTSSTSHSSSTSSTGAPCLHIPRDSYNALCTGVVTQKLTSRWSTCIWTPAKLLLLKFLPTTTSNKHKPRRMKARKRETQHKRHRKRGTVTLAPAWGRGWGGARREPALSAAPGVHPIPWSFTQPNIYIILSCWDPEKYRTPQYRTCNYRAELVKVRNMGANAIMEHNRIPTRIIERQKG